MLRTAPWATLVCSLREPPDPSEREEITSRFSFLRVGRKDYGHSLMNDTMAVGEILNKGSELAPASRRWQVSKLAGL